MEKLDPMFSFKESNSFDSVIVATAFVEAHLWNTGREFSFHERWTGTIGEVRIGRNVMIHIPPSIRWTSPTKPKELLYKVYRDWKSPKARNVLKLMDLRLCELLAPDDLLEIKECKLSRTFFDELNEYAATVSVIKM